MTPSRNNALDPWKCDFSGPQTKSSKDILTFNGILVKKILLTTSPNISTVVITKRYNLGTSKCVTPLFFNHMQQIQAL